MLDNIVYLLFKNKRLLQLFRELGRAELQTDYRRFPSDESWQSVITRHRVHTGHATEHQYRSEYLLFNMIILVKLNGKGQRGLVVYWKTCVQYKFHFFFQVNVPRM